MWRTNGVGKLSICFFRKLRYRIAIKRPPGFMIKPAVVRYHIVTRDFSRELITRYASTRVCRRNTYQDRSEIPWGRPVEIDHCPTEEYLLEATVSIWGNMSHVAPKVRQKCFRYSGSQNVMYRIREPGI